MQHVLLLCVFEKIQIEILLFVRNFLFHFYLCFDCIRYEIFRCLIQFLRLCTYFFLTSSCRNCSQLFKLRIILIDVVFFLIFIILSNSIFSLLLTEHIHKLFLFDFLLYHTLFIIPFLFLLEIHLIYLKGLYYHIPFFAVSINSEFMI